MDKGKDKEGAFAICTAQSQKAGYTEPGTKKLTGKGRKAEKKFAKKADMPIKAADYEKRVKGEDENAPRSLRSILEGIWARAAAALEEEADEELDVDVNVENS